MCIRDRHTTPSGTRACGGEHTVAGTPAAEGQVAGRAGCDATGETAVVVTQAYALDCPHSFLA